MRCGWGLALALLVVPLQGQAGPDASLRPVAREAAAPATGLSEGQEALVRISTSNALRPMARPVALSAALADLAAQERVWAARFARQGVVTAPTSDDLAANTPGVTETSPEVRSLRPSTRPRAIVQLAMAQRREERAGRAGGIQGVQGDVVGEVPGKGACGIDNALRVTAVSGVRLNPPALMDVPTAKALKSWVDNGLKPAVGNMGGGVESMRVGAHYICRTRNHQPGARLSEHSFGKAIDFSAFALRNGDQIILSRDWGGGKKGRALREMHRAACGPFGTVLGPEADRWHRDHFHFDTARHRSGSYCR